MHHIEISWFTHSKVIQPIKSTVPSRDLPFLSPGTYASRLRQVVASAARGAPYLFLIFYDVSVTYFIITYLIIFASLIMVCGTVKAKSTSYAEMTRICLQFNGDCLGLMTAGADSFFQAKKLLECRLLWPRAFASVWDIAYHFIAKYDKFLLSPAAAVTLGTIRPVAPDPFIDDHWIGFNDPNYCFPRLF